MDGWMDGWMDERKDELIDMVRQHDNCKDNLLVSRITCTHVRNFNYLRVQLGFYLLESI